MSRASLTSSGSICLTACSSSAGASLPRLTANVIWAWQEAHLGALQFVQRAPLGDGQQSQRSFGCAGLLLGLGRGQRPPTPERRIYR